MKRLIASLLLLALNASVSGQVPQARVDEGRALAADLRDAVPEKESEIRGVLQIRSRKTGVTNDVPVVCRIVLKDDGWETVYETAAAGGTGPEKLVVRRRAGQANEYLYSRAASPGDAWPLLKTLPPSEASLPLAGSDFSLTDFGLEFLHWPEQARTKGEMRLGRSCHVLESSRPGGEPVRVKSWIDKETGGLLIAEADDAAGKLMKEFSRSGSSFTKVNGRWQLEKMEIRNARSGSRTVLRFQLPRD